MDDEFVEVGFTGTQQGMTDLQELTVTRFLRDHAVTAVHHGDCIGADATVHAIAESMGLWLVVHPPTDDSKRAFCKRPDEEREPRPYLERNRDIVRETRLLLATPAGPERTRSGTWATVRYARKAGRAIVIVHPDGSVTEEQETP